jgi:hypothetical protein
VTRGSGGCRHASDGRSAPPPWSRAALATPLNGPSKTYGICSTRTSGQRRERKAVAVLGQPQGTHREITGERPRVRSSRSSCAPLLTSCGPRCRRPQVQDFPGNPERPSLRTLRAATSSTSSASTAAITTSTGRTARSACFRPMAAIRRPWGSETLSPADSVHQLDPPQAPFRSATYGLIRRDLLGSEADESSAFDVDPADLVFARARETL